MDERCLYTKEYTNNNIINTIVSLTQYFFYIAPVDDEDDVYVDSSNHDTHQITEQPSTGEIVYSYHILSHYTEVIIVLLAEGDGWLLDDSVFLLYNI